MKSNSHQKFKLIAFLTFIVYFIIVLFGYINITAAGYLNKNYFPLRSYLITFSDSEIINIGEIKKSLYNLAGYKALISSSLPYKAIDDIFFTLVSVILIVLFYLGYKFINKNDVSQKEIIKWSIVFSICMTLAIPAHSSDLYGYIARGVQQSLYNQNPYIETISTISGYAKNPLFLNSMWPFQPTTYGPLFISLTKSIAYLSDNNFLTMMLNFKLLNLTVFMFLILYVLRLNKTTDLYLIAWNPLILIQGLWNNHNDLISGTLIFFGLYFFTRSKAKNKYFWGMFFLVLSAAIKYIAILLIPFVLIYSLRKKALIESVIGLVCGFLIISIFSADYLTITNNFSNLESITSNINLVHKSLIATILTLAKYIFRELGLIFNENAFERIFKLIFYFSFAIFYIFTLLRKRGDLILSSVLILFIFIGFTLAKFHSWYLLNVIILLPLLSSILMQQLLIILSLSHIFAITFIDQAKILNFVSMTLLPVLFVLFKKKGKA